MKKSMMILLALMLTGCSSIPKDDNPGVCSDLVAAYQNSKYEAKHMTTAPKFCYFIQQPETVRGYYCTEFKSENYASGKIYFLQGLEERRPATCENPTQ